MEDVARAVDKDLTGHIHVADINSFLDKFFPVRSEDIDAIFDQVTQPNVTSGYDGKRWKGLPVSRALPELAHYEPLTAVANAIRKAATSLYPNSANSSDEAVGNDHDAAEANDGEDPNAEERAAGDGQNVGPSEADMDVDSADKETDTEEDEETDNEGEDDGYTTAVHSTQNSETPCDAPINGIWLDRHAIPPQSKIEGTAAIRPDLVFASFPDVLEKLDKDISKARRSARIEEQADQKKTAVSKNPDVLEQVWWQQIHSPFEIKRDEQELKAAIVQLFNYLRRILQEQLDRRFAIGLLLYFDHLAICMCDRSGGIFTKNAFSIHKDPKQFIRVIAGFSLLKPQQLGWDPGMKVFIPTENRGVPSYTISPKQTSKNNYRTYWLIDLPSPDGGPVQQVVTVRGISLARAEVMCGRATIVWEVIKYSEFPKPKKLFILKRYWRPAESPVDGTQQIDGPTAVESASEPLVARPRVNASTMVKAAPEHPVENPSPQTNGPMVNEPISEGIVAEDYFYHLAGVKDERLEFGNDITIDGAVDSTLGFIRQGLATEPTSWKGLKEDIESAPDKPGSKRTRRETDDNAENSLHLSFGFLFDLEEDPVEIIARIHTQLLMKDPGPWVKHFSCLMELVSVTRDCVQDHKTFHSKNVLHRDVSPGNMIIVPQDPLWKDPAKGRLIDLDHAKHTAKEKMTTLTSKDPVPEDLIDQLLSILRYEASEHDLSKLVGRDVIVAALHALGHTSVNTALNYILKAIEVREKYFGLTPPQDGAYHCADLGWDKEDKAIPDFDDRQARLGFRTGTLPYMSYEVLAKKIHPIFYGSNPRRKNVQFFHDAVHDVDSFDWVLIHICLTRKGPGMNMLRGELESTTDQSPKARAVRRLVKELFDSEEAVIKEKRMDLLAVPELLEEKIIPHFHNYFKPLVPMIKQYWHTLALAYRFRAFEYFHAQDFAIDILERFEAKYKLDTTFNNIEDDNQKKETATVNGLDDVDTRREINRRINHYTRALTVFERPPDAPGQNSFTMTPKKDTNTESMPAPRPDPESPSRPQNSRKKPRV